MGRRTGIEWTGSTWNVTTGCSAVSLGCKNCYAEHLSVRLQRMGLKRYARGFTPTVHPEALLEPKKWKDPRMIFTVSMGDLFHRDIPDAFLVDVFNTMQEVAPWHTYQVLTKRPLRLLNFQRDHFPAGFPQNVWVGTSVENNLVVKRADFLRQVSAKSGVRFLSCEPLLGSVDRLDLSGVSWLIAGGESGPNHRTMQADWARWIRDECVRLEIPFFFKQWGGARAKSGGRTLDGRTWSEMPSTHPP